MAFRLDKLTVKAQESVARAQDLATERGNPLIDSLHLLSGLLDESDGIVKPIFDKIGVNRSQIAGMVDTELARLPKASGGSAPSINKELSSVLQASSAQADTMRDEFVSTEHLLLALTEVDCQAKNILQMNGVAHNDILEALKSVRGSSRVTDQTPEDKFQAERLGGFPPKTQISNSVSVFFF